MAGQDTAIGGAADQREQVDTAKVTGRREVRYESYDELLADAERLAATEVRTLGNWTFARILDHMSKSLEGMIDGMGFLMPAPARFGMRLLMKRKMLSRTLPPGFKIPRGGNGVLPEERPLGEALEGLRSAIGRAQSESERSLHPAFGKLTREEWDQFQLRHCEMHMSFVTPRQQSG